MLDLLIVVAFVCAVGSGLRAGTASQSYEVLDHIAERLFQVEGRLTVEPDASRASRITMTVPTEGRSEALREAAEWSAGD